MEDHRRFVGPLYRYSWNRLYVFLALRVDRVLHELISPIAHTIGRLIPLPQATKIASNKMKILKPISEASPRAT